MRGTLDSSTPQANITVVPGTDQLGVKTVKHVLINLSTDEDFEFYWAIVYVPQGTTIGSISTPTVDAPSMYEPNQYIMGCGIIDPSAGPIRIRTRVARKLHSGDAIVLIVSKPGAVNSAAIQGTVTYAIRYN